MFDERATQAAIYYQRAVENTIDNLKEIGFSIKDLIAAIIEKAFDKFKKEKVSEVEIQIDSEKFRLVPDEEYPGAWKWESAQMTDFQAENVARKLMTEEVETMRKVEDVNKAEKNSLTVTATTESGEKIVVYNQDSEGKCLTNLVTENLNAEEIIDTAQKLINRNLSSAAEDKSAPLPKVETQRGDNTAIEEETSISKRKLAYQHSDAEVPSSKEVSSQTNKNWVREVEVPIKQPMANSRAEHKRQQLEDANIAKTAKEMLKTYGETLPNACKLYKSDAFVIQQQGDKYSIHRRRDELTNFANPLMEFTQNSKGEIKIKTPPTQMLSVERHEFLMVGERLESGKKLPKLANVDLRDVANNLGSLAPAGTFKTLESFRETEMLGLLNSALQKANTDTLTVGEYTISRARNVEAGKANLSLYKTVESGERRELLSFTLQKTDAGLIKQVDKLSIGDWDLAQLKFISENAKAFDIGNTFTNKTGEQQRSNQSVSELKVPLHPAIADALNQLDALDDSKWQQENKQIKQNLQNFEGKLSISEQRELYFKIIAQQQLDSSTEQIKIPPFKEIMKDLLCWRQEDISNKYTPKEYIPMTQEISASKNSSNSKSQAELSL